jgi:hypothetical protein
VARTGHSDKSCISRFVVSLNGFVMHSKLHGAKYGCTREQSACSVWSSDDIYKSLHIDVSLRTAGLLWRLGASGILSPFGPRSGLEQG